MFHVFHFKIWGSASFQSHWDTALSELRLRAVGLLFAIITIPWQPWWLCKLSMRINTVDQKVIAYLNIGCHLVASFFISTCDDPKILVRNISAYNFHTCVSSAFILYFFEEFYSRLYGNRVAAHFPSLNHHISPLHIRAEIVEEMESIFRFYDHQGSL